MRILESKPLIVLAFLAVSISAGVHCLPMEERLHVLKLTEMERIKANILTQLGYTEPPSAVEPLSPGEEATVEAFKDYLTAKEDRKARAKRNLNEKPNPKHISTFVGELQKQDTTIPRISDVMSAHSEYTDYIVQVYSVQFDLDLQGNTTMGRVVQAEILLFQDLPMLNQSDPHLHVEIKVTSDGPTPTVSTKHVGKEAPGYTTFDITSVLKPWFANNPKGPLVLKVSAYCMDSLHCNMPVFDDGLGDKQPKLLISKELEDDSSQQRRKRQSSEPGVGFCQPDTTTCCLHPLTINFKEDLGFTFVLQPKQFDANFCLGFCPEVSDALMTPGVYEMYSRIGLSVEPCCVTHRTRELEALLRVDGILIIEELQDVIVNSCRCG